MGTAVYISFIPEFARFLEFRWIVIMWVIAELSWCVPFLECLLAILIPCAVTPLSPCP